MVLIIKYKFMQKKWISIVLLFFCAKSYSQLVTISTTGKSVIANKVVIQDSTPGICFGKTDTSLIDSGSDGANLSLSGDPYRTFSTKAAVFSPLKGPLYITSSFGSRLHPVFRKETLHAGVDFRADHEEVIAIAGGIIVKTGYGTREGRYMVVLHGRGIESIYCHLSTFIYNYGDYVSGGDVIAISGNTGEVTGPHLHFGIKVNGNYINPIPFLLAVIKYKSE